MGKKSPTKLSCDRCHALKERCCWSADSSSCNRCVRSRRVCQTVRRIGKPGRPLGTFSRRMDFSQNQTSGPPTACQRLSSHTAEVATAKLLAHSLEDRVSIFGDFSGDELRMLDGFLFCDDIVQQFVIGPSFCQYDRERLVSSLLRFKPFLKHGYLALASAWNEETDSTFDTLRHASSALQTLRSIRVRDSEDAALCLALGSIVDAFVLRLGIGNYHSICEYVLGLIKPLFSPGGDPQVARLDFVQCLVLTDIWECLILSRVPVLRLDVDEPMVSTVDRNAGICAPLLPLLHDLCELTSRIRAFGFTSDIRDALQALELRIHNWNPAIPDELSDLFTPNEKVPFLCQSQGIQMTAILIIHRLRHPYGSELETATAYSSFILGQIHAAWEATRSVPPLMDVPMLVACLELHDEESAMRWFHHLSPTGAYSPTFSKRLSDILGCAWASWKQREDFYWYDVCTLVPASTMGGIAV